MTFPLYIFLILYSIFLAIWLIFGLVAIFHMFRFGLKNFTTFLTTFIFIAVSFLLLVVSYNYLSPIDWGINITIFDGLIDFNVIFH